MSKKTKLIKVTSRGLVMTSRGICRSPLGQYKENVENILVMITKNKATVVEVLPDGKEIPLTIQNFDKDNTGAEVVTEEPVKEPVKPAELKKVEEPKKEEPQQPAQEENSNKQLSRKERKRLEYEKRNAEKKEEVKAEETVETEKSENDASPVEETVETTEVPAEAIEE